MLQYCAFLFSLYSPFFLNLVRKIIIIKRKQQNIYPFIHSLDILNIVTRTENYMKMICSYTKYRPKKRNKFKINQSPEEYESLVHLQCPKMYFYTEHCHQLKLQSVLNIDICYCNEGCRELRLQLDMISFWYNEAQRKERQSTRSLKCFTEAQMFVRKSELCKSLSLN